jgi:hypothetical protein
MNDEKDRPDTIGQESQTEEPEGPKDPTTRPKPSGPNPHQPQWNKLPPERAIRNVRDH